MGAELWGRSSSEVVGGKGGLRGRVASPRPAQERQQAGLASPSREPAGYEAFNEVQEISSSMRFL